MKEIRKIIQAYDEWKQSGYDMAIATVVKVEESSYRRIGARMLVSSLGLFVGGISGGCLEGNALKKAQLAIHKNAVSKVVYDTLEEEDHQIGIGLGCNGRIEILFAPIHLDDPNNPVELLRRTIEANKLAIMLKIINSDDPALIGNNYLLFDNFESVAFGNLKPSEINAAAQNTLLIKRPRAHKLINLDGKHVELLVEYLRPETRLIIFGNNYDVNALIGVAEALGWQISVVGKKAKILKSIANSVKRIYDYSEIDQLPIDEYTAIVLMTHDYAWDVKMIPHFIGHGISYLGMLGPRKRFDKINAELMNQGVTEDLSDLEHLHTPVGLDIGAESPEEIALAIVAEIVSRFRKRDARPLKHRRGSIHERTYTNQDCTN